MQPDQTMSIALFAFLFAMVLVWFVLIRMFFKRLETNHPAKYEAMGRPSLFLRNHISGNWATFKFLITREHKALNDPWLSKLSDFMLAFISAYVILFVVLTIVIGQVAPRP